MNNQVQATPTRLVQFLTGNMASKASKVVKGVKKVTEKVHHRPYLSTYIKAGQAMPAPPLGTQLGQVNQILVLC